MVNNSLNQVKFNLYLFNHCTNLILQFQVPQTIKEMTLQEIQLVATFAFISCCLTQGLFQKSPSCRNFVRSRCRLLIQKTTSVAFNATKYLTNLSAIDGVFKIGGCENLKVMAFRSKAVFRHLSKFSHWLSLRSHSKITFAVSPYF